MTNYVCTYKDEKWYASYKIIERSDKYSILKIESKFKDLEIFLWHSNNNFWLAIPNETLSVNLSYPDDEFWNYESLYHYTKDEIISKTIVKGISTYYKDNMSKQKIHELYEKIDYLESELDIALFEVKHQRNDIKRFLLLLIENDIPIPEDLINKYINKALVKPAIKLPF